MHQNDTISHSDADELMRRVDDDDDYAPSDEELAVLAALGRCPDCGQRREAPAPLIDCGAFHSVPTDGAEDTSTADTEGPSASEPSSDGEDDPSEDPDSASEDPDSASSEAVPQEMRDRGAWACYRLVVREGKPTKVPHMPDGRLASATDALTWSSFDAATCAPGFDGIGFVFSSGDPFFGIDLDRAFDEHGTLKPWADEIVQPFLGRAYIEYSPSGTGLHIIGKGKAPWQGKVKIEDGMVEIYDRERYFTVTGKPYEGPVAS